ncbi:IS3 family transposase [Lignipirellula cremea]|uniref:Integrase core domain protein n=1 Tax=Lignipirellula cremea TaxID=2528010 RepID=A0A518DPG2_9BACT|nr:IS3 family transposase [Lignipirellula cremea]QDU93719.1 Integrase core domain protein [Lignipirellula cremea]
MAAADQIVAAKTASVAEVCDCLAIPRSIFYEHRSPSTTKREERTQRLTPFVMEIFWKHRRRYGSRRIVDDLADRGIVACRRTVANIMKTQGLHAIQPKSFKPKTTDSRHKLGYSPNLLLQEFSLTAINQLWVADITYIPLYGKRFAYLAMLMDRYSRRLIGWSLDLTMTDALVLSSLRVALRSRQLHVDLIHHSDRGGQYASNRFRGVLRRASIRQSMSRAADCYANAFMESCFGTIKTELEMTEYESMQTADRELAEYFAYNNRDRKHSSLGYQTPHQFETNQPGPK